MPNRFNKYINPLFLIGDVLLLNVALMIASFIWFGSISFIYSEPYLTLVFVANIGWVFLELAFSSYEVSRVNRMAKVVRGIIVFLVLHMLIVSGFWVFQKAYYYSRGFLMTMYGTLFVLFIFWRVSVIYLLRIYRKQGFNFRNVIIFGYGEVAEELRKFFLLHPESGYRFIGFFSNLEKGPKILGNFNNLHDFTIDNRVDEIYCCIPYIKYEQLRRLIDFGEENLIKVKLISDFRGFSFKGLELERYDHIPVLNVSSIPLDDIKNRIMKRTFDIVFSFFVILFVMSWLYPLTALAIKLSSKGPVVFKQQRTGKGNDSFWCYKFRTMRQNVDSDYKQASKDDNRITWIGKILRKTSIDEFPQFFNVLIGNMSVVGPRPHMLKHTEEYTEKIEKFMARHFVKPGITGLAQARGYRGETNSIYQMKGRVKLDRFYIENWSFFFDLKIIILTSVSLYKESQKAY